MRLGGTERRGAGPLALGEQLWSAAGGPNPSLYLIGAFSFAAPAEISLLFQDMVAAHLTSSRPVAWLTDYWWPLAQRNGSFDTANTKL